MRYLVCALGVAIVQGAMFFALLGEQITRAEHFGVSRYKSGILDVAVEALGAPIFYLVRAEWTFWLRPYLGDDLWIIVLLAALNAICWGAVAAGLVWWWRHRQTTAACSRRPRPGAADADR